MRLSGLQRGVAKCLVLAGLLAGAPRLSPADAAADPAAIEAVLGGCSEAEASLTRATAELVQVGEDYRPSLAAARSSLRNARSALAASEWPDDSVRDRARLAGMLRSIEERVARLARRSTEGAIPHLRRSLRGVAERMQVTHAFAQEVAPKAPAPLDHANPPRPAPQAAPTATGFAWTNLSPSADSRVVYVSNSRSDDSGDGLSPETAKKTLAAAYALLRDGYPDWMLLKKGDAWVWEHLINTQWGKSGRSASEPLVVTSYGSGARPRIVNGACFTNRTSNFALVDISFDVSSIDDPQQWGTFVDSAGSNLLIEGCYYARGGVNIQRMSNVKFRGNVVVDAWHTAGAVGAFFDEVDNLLVEGCVFDHNGWREPNIPRSWFTHNIYIQVTCSNVTVRNNVFARGSGEGCMQRPGGLNENNLLLQSPLGLTWGYGAWTFEQARATGIIRNNVILDAADLTPGVPRGVGISIVNAADVEVTGNIIAHQATATWGYGITTEGTLQNVKIRNNITYDWNGGGTYQNATIGMDVQGTWRGSAGTSDVTGNTIQLSRGMNINVGGNSPDVLRYSGNTYYNAGPAGGHFRYWGTDTSDAGWPAASGESGAVFAQPNYVDPNRTIATYMTSLGGTATLDAFLAEARLQSKSNWRSQFTAPVVNDYIRQGFAIQGQ